MKIISFLKYFIFASLVVTGQIIFSGFGEFSDGLNYYNAFNSMANEDVFNGFTAYKIYSGSTEPISYIFFYLFSQVTDFYITNTILNFLLLCALNNYFTKFGIKFYVWLPLVITNYYILLVGYAVLRLKIGLIFYIIYIYNQNIGAAFLSFLSHFQMFIMFFISQINSNKNLIKFSYYKIIFIGSISLIFYLSNIEDKINYYIIMNDIFLFPYKSLFFFIISLFIIKDLKKSLIIYAFILLFIYFFGEGRINLLYFILILDIFIKNNENNILSKVLISISVIYLSIKGLDFGISWSNQENYFN